VKPKARSSRPTGAEPPRLAEVEAQIEVQERLVADLERRLADDWNDLEAIEAHRGARQELQALLARWEVLFEEASS
jgi:uncharacterized coiled-coil protein SlyX